MNIPTFETVRFGQPLLHSHQLEWCPVDDPKANCTFSSGKSCCCKSCECGKPYSAARYSTDNYAIDLYDKKTGEHLHGANWSVPHQSNAEIPDTAIFIAKSFERRNLKAQRGTGKKAGNG